MDSLSNQSISLDPIFIGQFEFEPDLLQLNCTPSVSLQDSLIIQTPGGAFRPTEKLFNKVTTILHPIMATGGANIETLNQVHDNNSSQTQSNDGFTKVRSRKQKRRRLLNDHDGSYCERLSDTSTEISDMSGVSQQSSLHISEYPTQLLIHAVISSVSLSRTYSQDVFTHLLNAQGLPPTTIKRVGNHYLATVPDRHYYETLKSITHINKVKITTAIPHWLKEVKGVIRWDPQIDDDTLKEAVEDVNSVRNQPQIINFDRIKINTKPTPSIILTFATTTLPQTISFGGDPQKLVEPLLRKPTCCNRCLQYGHTIKNCPNAEVCNKCGYTGHSYKSCQNNKYCIHCNKSGHTSLSFLCPIKKQKVNNMNKHNKQPSRLLGNAKKPAYETRHARFNHTNNSQLDGEHERPRSSTPKKSQAASNIPTPRQPTPPMLRQTHTSKLLKEFERVTQDQITQPKRYPGPSRQPQPLRTKSNSSQNNRSLNVTINRQYKPTNNRQRRPSNNKQNNSVRCDNMLQNSSLTAISQLIEFIAETIIISMPYATTSEKNDCIYKIFQAASNRGLYNNSLHSMKTNAGLSTYGRGGRGYSHHDNDY